MEGWKEHIKLKDVQVAAGKSLKEILEVVEKHLHKEKYTKAEVCQQGFRNLMICRYALFVLWGEETLSTIFIH